MSIKTFVKTFVKKCMPPIFFDLLTLLNLKNHLYYFGNFKTWDDALKESHRLGGDYEDKDILDQVDQAIQKVRKGEALYEQDGVCYYHPNNNWELLSALFYVRAMLYTTALIQHDKADMYNVYNADVIAKLDQAGAIHKGETANMSVLDFGGVR